MRRFESREKRFSARVLASVAAAGLAPGLGFLAAAGDAPAEILLYDEIGYFGTTAAEFAQALAQAGDGPLTLRINSPGGDVFDGYAIYNMLKARAGAVNVVIDGVAASAASFIAMAGSTVTMGEPSLLMIHNCWGLCIGDRNDMRDAADVQEKIDGQIAAIYASKSGKPVEEMAAAMDAETWYTSTDAQTAGLCDAVMNSEAAAKAKASLAAARLTNRGGEPAPTTAVDPNAAATSAEWQCGAAEDLPIDETASWDGPAAAEKMLDDAGFNGDSPDPAKAKRGFLAWDHHNPKLKSSYKLPFADLVDGKLTALKSGVDAAASRLPDTDIPDGVKTSARSVLDAYEKRMKPEQDLADTALQARRRRARLAEAEAA